MIEVPVQILRTYCWDYLLAFRQSQDSDNTTGRRVCALLVVPVLIQSRLRLRCTEYGILCMSKIKSVVCLSIRVSTDSFMTRLGRIETRSRS